MHIKKDIAGLRKYSKALKDIFKEPLSDFNTENYIKTSNKFIYDLINDELSFYAQEKIIKKWAGYAFRYFDCKENPLLPVIFFACLFEVGELIYYREDIMNEYIGYIADYILKHRKSVVKYCLDNNSVRNDRGLDILYRKFTRTMLFRQKSNRKKYIIIGVYILSLTVLFGAGISAGSKMSERKDNNDVSESADVSDTSGTDSKISDSEQKNDSQKSIPDFIEPFFPFQHIKNSSV